MPALQTFASPVKRRLTVTIPREYDGYSFEVIMVPVMQPPKVYDGSAASRHAVRKVKHAKRNPLSQFIGCIDGARRTDDVVRELRGYEQW